MKRRNSLFVILLSALLIISMMSAMAFAKERKEEPKKEKAEHHAVKPEDISVQEEGVSLQAGETVYYPVWVGETRVTSDNMNGVLNDGGKVNTAHRMKNRER